MNGDSVLTRLRPARTEPRAEARADTRAHPDADTPARTPAEARAWTRRNADGMAVASFVLGLTGLLVFNLVLGPMALVLGGLALHRGTGRRRRAFLGLGLGAADLLVLAALATADGTVSWGFTG